MFVLNAKNILNLKLKISHFVKSVRKENNYMETKELTLVETEAQFNTLRENFKTLPGREKVQEDFETDYKQYALKYLIEALDHIDSVKRANTRLAELPALIEAKTKEIEELSYKNDPEFHKKEKREKTKELEKELETLEAEQKQYPEDIKHRLTLADLSLKNYTFQMERLELLKRI